MPTYAGRVRLTPVQNQENVYDLVRADEPIQEGTPLNKANLLTDETAQAMGLTSDATPNDAFSRLQTNINNKAPAYTYGTDDLTAGESPLETGKLYFVYE